MIHNGSRKVNFHSIAIDIFRLCMANGITLNSRWIPRSLTNFADFVSKLTDYDDWVVSERLFLYLDLEWGPHTIDRFTNIANKKLECFNSLFWAPGSEAVNAFSQNWAGENNWLVPPIYLISSVIRHLLACNASGTIIVPFWPSAHFWSLQFKTANVLHDYIIDLRFFKNPDGY